MERMADRVRSMTRTRLTHSLSNSLTSSPLKSAASSTIPPLAQLIILTPSLHLAIVASSERRGREKIKARRGGEVESEKGIA